MAAYDFPPTAGQPTDGSFEYTAPDGTLYEWNGYAWIAPFGDAQDIPALDVRYVNVTGDNMTGDLTLGTDKITLNADGSSYFTGDMGIGGTSASPKLNLRSNGNVTFDGTFIARANSRIGPLDPVLAAKGNVQLMVSGANATGTGTELVLQNTGQGSSATNVISSITNLTGTNGYSTKLEFDQSGNISFGGKSPTSNPSDLPDTSIIFNAAGNISIGGTLPSAPNISLNANGSGNFKRAIRPGGEVKVVLASDNGGLEFGIGIGDSLTANTKQLNAYIYNDGSATFAGFVTVEDQIKSNRTTTSATCFRADLNNVPKVQIYADGHATFAGTVTATVVPPSDARFKENITPANPQLADVVALGGLLKNYDWNADAPVNDELRKQRQLGLIAQEAETVCPGLVKTIARTKQGKELTPEVVVPAVYREVPDSDNDGKTIKELVTPEQVTEATYEELDDSFKGLSTDVIIMKLLGAVAELKAEVEASAALEARLYTALQTALTRIEALEAEVNALKGA